MRRTILFALVALTMFGGVAAADRYRGPVYRDHRSGGVHVQLGLHGGYRGHNGYYGGYPYNRYYPGRYYYQRPPVHVVRRPIYVQRPILRFRYYNYAQRPTAIVESYRPITGYDWVPGQWYWDGYEWRWQPGRYQPDPRYPYQYSGYSGYGYPSYDDYNRY